MELEMIRNIIADQLSISVDTITEDTVLEDLGADSLDVFQIVSALEEELEIEISTEDSEKVKTVKDLVQFISDMV